MKKTVIKFCLILCNCVFAIAQTSEFFNISFGKYEIELTPKNIVEVEKGASRMPSCDFISLTEQVIAPIVKENFNKLSEDQSELLKHIKFYFIFNEKLKIVYCRFTVDKKYQSEIKNIEKELYNLSQKFLYIDVSPYFKVEDDQFKGMEICTGRSLYGSYMFKR